VNGDSSTSARAGAPSASSRATADPSDSPKITTLVALLALARFG
jgi:hypothetical protein